MPLMVWHFSTTMQIPQISHKVSSFSRISHCLKHRTLPQLFSLLPNCALQPLARKHWLADTVNILLLVHPSLNTCLSHLAPQGLKARPHTSPWTFQRRFSWHINPALSCTRLVGLDEGLSKHQMALYQCLILCLPISGFSATNNQDLKCLCGQQRNWYGYHSLNCNRHAGLRVMHTRTNLHVISYKSSLPGSFYTSTCVFA